MNKTEEKAVSLLVSGLNCAQAIVSAYSERLGYDNELALNISCGFGGGMGRLQKTCGAVTGAFMVLSIYNGKKYTENSVRKIMSYAMIQDFNSKFLAAHGTTECSELLNCDLKTEEGLEYHHQNNLSEKVCQNCIRS
ncbi:MAG: C-GCAxxG-C-C family protein, partial [Bacteroidota bacterium]|nr:C-GCAxxG-C-C family protein [Bacteroidota bacterium]